MTAARYEADAALPSRARARLALAQFDLQAEEARSRARIAEDAAAAQIRLAAKREREAARDRAREARRARLGAFRTAAGEWASAHTVDLLFIPVIGIPAALAWTGMADYGLAEYGPPGVALPGLSEGGMWAFAAATTLRRREDDKRRLDDPDADPRPLWHLRLGTVIFAAYGAALNFLHGLASSGPLSGLTMALVSVAGVTAHQLITAGPRRSRSERDRARVARVAARRERAAQRAASRHALVDVDDEGRARLVYEPGLFTLTRQRGSLRLARPGAQPAQGAQQPAQAAHTLFWQRVPAGEGGDGRAMTVPLRFNAGDGRTVIVPVRFNAGWPPVRLTQRPAAQPAQGEPGAARDDLDTEEKRFPGNVDKAGGGMPGPEGTVQAPAPPADPNREEEGDSEYTKALKALRRTALAGNPLSGRQLKARYGISRSQMEEIVALVSGEQATAK